MLVRVSWPDWDREGRVFEAVVYALSVLRVSDEPSGVTTTHGGFGDMDHVLRRIQKRLSAIMVKARMEWKPQRYLVNNKI